MKSLWWKFLALAILVYAAVRSLLTPLNPCILDVGTGTVSPGEQVVDVIGYRTHFQDTSVQFMLLASGVVEGDTVEHWLVSRKVTATDGDHAQVAFTIPQQLPDTVLDLYANTDLDGTLYLPNALRLENFTAGMPLVASAEIQVERNEPAELGFPFQVVLFETIRNLCWHVPMWFTMFLLMIIAVVNSIQYLIGGKVNSDLRAKGAVDVGLMFCLLGLITGSFWARFTWGDWWVDDPQLNGAMVTFMIYVAYAVLRASIDDPDKRARIAAVYNIFAFAMLVVLLMVLPRFTESLHPGKGSSPAFSQYDLDDTLRWVFYPAVIGWMLVSVWLYNLNVRLDRVRLTIEERS